MRTHRFLAAAAAVPVILSALSCSKDVNAGGMSFPPMPAEVAEARVQKVFDRFEAVGTLEAMEAVTVVAEIDGSVTDLPFQEGVPIRKGDVIAILDDSQLGAELARAEALEAQSHATYERVKSVVEQHAGTPQDLDDAAAGLKVADANLSVAKSRFNKTRVRAPFDGIIGARKVSPGTFLRAGSEIADMANIDDIRVQFSAPERFLSQLARGAAVSVSTTAFPGYTLTGKIISIEPVLDPATRSARVVARVANPGRKFRPGMSANISAVLGERPSAVTVPNEAVFANGDQSFVFIVKPDSSVVRTAITLGTRMTDRVEVIAGIQPGTSVVRAGHQKLFDGAKVMPLASDSAAATTNQAK